ncbi:MAG: hypothetical protein OXG33_11685 [Chloroflexi bacterium]|nr:hypothetical protein [Chloroflexota bacterium]
MALPVAHAQQVFVSGAVVALEGTPHLWIADDQGVLHLGGDTRALSGRHINWNARTEVSLAGLRALPKGDPWLSAGLLKQGDPIYLVKWETEWPQPRLLHIQSIADVEIFGINESNYGKFVLDVPTWEARYGMSVASLQRAELPAAVPGAGTMPTTPTTPTTPTVPASSALPYQRINGFDVGAGTMNLPQGTVTLRLQFGGWGVGPVTVTYGLEGGATTHLLNNARVPYYSEIDINVPQAGTYAFRVTAPRDWRVWVGLEPGLPSVPLPMQGCRTTVQWHRAGNGIHRASFSCGSSQVDGTSYSDINTKDKFWAVWFRDKKFFAVTSTGASFTATDASIPFQILRGYNGGAGELSLPVGNVTIMIEYGNWSEAPITLVINSPNGAQTRPLDGARVGYRTNVPISVAQAGVHGIQVDAQGAWRLWVGVEAASTVDELAEVDVPASGCSTSSKWKEVDGYYRARFECPSFNLRAVHYPGLAKSDGFWVIWTNGNVLHRITFHKT